MSKRVCPTCKTEYDDGGDVWKKRCYDCYKNYRTFDGQYGGPVRIRKLGYKSGVYITHPSVTAEDLTEYIKKEGYETGWGPTEWDPASHADKFKIWVNSENYD